MQLNTTTKYAISILGYMAQNNTVQYSSKQLSEILNIPYKYLTKIMTKLTKYEILSSTKGKYGGFKIIKNIKDIKIIDIVNVFDDTKTQECVLLDIKCDVEQKCIMHDKWQKPKCAIDDFFTKTTLLELIDKSSMIQVFK
jgi:Rrf2 family protein